MFPDEFDVLIDVVTRHHDVFDARIIFFQNAQQLETVHERHLDIRNDQIGGGFGNEFQRGPSVSGHSGDVLFLREEVRENTAYLFIIVNDKNGVSIQNEVLI